MTFPISGDFSDFLAVVWQHLVLLYNSESSAKSLVVQDTHSGTLSIKMRKNRVPRTDPCGTPDITEDWLETCPSSGTREGTYKEPHLRPYNIASVCCFSFIPVARPWMVRISWISLDPFFLKQNYASDGSLMPCVSISILDIPFATCPNFQSAGTLP